ALYYLASYALFMYLWRPHTGDSRHIPLVLQALGITQLLAAALMPWPMFQWAGAVIWGAAIFLGIFMVGRKVGKNPRGYVTWRALLAALTVIVVIACLGFTILDQPDLVDSFPVIGALILANIIVALGVTGMVRSERKNRIRVQTELVTSYAVAPLGLFTLDEGGYFVGMNPGLMHMLDLPEDASIAGKHWDDFFEAQDWQAVSRATIAGNETEIHLLSDGAGRPRHFALRAAVVDGHVEGSLQDITARTQAMAELRDMMDSDPLTQTLNRRGIEKKLERAIETMKTRGQPCSLAYMDLDHFKRINGLFGHTSGDEILRQVTDRLRNILTRYQTLGRIGSDEFIILFPNMDANAARAT